MVTQSRPCLDCKSEGSVDDGRPDYLEYPEYEQLLLAVLRSPGDDLPRLVLADWLEEYWDDPLRAEFIRVQCELATAPAKYRGDRRWFDTRYSVGDAQIDGLRLREQELWNFGASGTWVDAMKPPFDCFQCIDSETISRDKSHDPILVYRRGFIGEVRLTLAAFVGGECESCLGTGQFRSTYTFFGEHLTGPCYACSSTGRIAGHAKSLFEAHPIAEIVFTDAVLNRWLARNNELFMWENLPEELLAHYPRVGGGVASDPYEFVHSTDYDAEEALSEAGVRLGRSLANLDPIPAILSDGTPFRSPLGKPRVSK